MRQRPVYIYFRPSAANGAIQSAPLTWLPTIYYSHADIRFGRTPRDHDFIILNRERRRRRARPLISISLSVSVCSPPNE